MSKRLKERGIEPTEEQRQLFESFFESLIRNVANNLVEQRKVYEMDEEIRRQDELEKEQMIRRTLQMQIMELYKI
ncbi:10341_t:CDS:2 [Ambispora leptoticha]|uniref:10341_t:CDS:1 n=1 Tax=Ambispora leptoticha TaxID=144679 RepID=A0A9N8VVM7_9GLOM|nr:10341_t:CDS:2 [Ambispora leptoticha]